MSYQYQRSQATEIGQKRKQADLQRMGKAMLHLQAAYQEITCVQLTDWVDRVILAIGHANGALVQAARTWDCPMPPEMQADINMLAVSGGLVG